MMKNKKLVLIACATMVQPAFGVTDDIWKSVNNVISATPLSKAVAAGGAVSLVQTSAAKCTQGILARIKPHRLEDIRLYSDKTLFSLTDEQIGQLLAGKLETNDEGKTFLDCLPREQQVKICTMLKEDNGKLSPYNTKLGLNQLVPNYTEQELRDIIKIRRANAQKRNPIQFSKEWFMRKVGHKGFMASARLTCLGSKVKIKTKDNHDFDIPYFEPTCTFAKGSEFMEETMPFIDAALPIATGVAVALLGKKTVSAAASAVA